MHEIYKKYVRICKNIKIQNDIKESKDTKRRNQCQFLILIQHQMKKKPAECTYTVIRSNENEATAEKPMMVLDNKICQWDHHSCGVFTNPIKRTSFEFQQEDGTVSADILKIDARFVSLLKWLGENHINVRLSGENTEEGYAVYKIRETAFGGGTKLSAEDGFLQFMIERLFASSAPAEEVDDEDEDEAGDDMKLTSLQSITDFMTCAGKNTSGQYPPLGEKKPCSGTFTRSISGGETSCSAGAFHHDECTVEEQLF